jgi:IclR family transcriptional regulator, acetate operon repressor
MECFGRMSSVQSIERAFALLQRLASGPAGVTDLAERVALPKSTVSRLLSTLEQLGAVEQASPGGPYQIGPKMIEIVASVMPRRGLVECAHPHLVELTRLTGEASGLSIRAGDDVRYVDQVESDNPVQVRDWTGTRAPLHSVPSGLVLLAHASEEDQRAYLSTHLVAFTRRTMTDPEQIAARLQAIRETGFTWVLEEFSEGINSVAAPIFDENGTVVAAVHAHGPAYRFPKADNAAEIGAQVTTAARRIGSSIART